MSNCSPWSLVSCNVWMHLCIKRPESAKWVISRTSCCRGNSAIWLRYVGHIDSWGWELDTPGQTHKIPIEHIGVYTNKPERFRDMVLRFIKSTVGHRIENKNSRMITKPLLSLALHISSSLQEERKCACAHISTQKTGTGRKRVGHKSPSSADKQKITSP